MPLERGGEIGPRETFDSRPQPDVRRRRVLGLKPADALEDGRDGRPCACEELLSREHGPLQLAPGEQPDSGHGEMSSLAT